MSLRDLATGTWGGIVVVVVVVVVSELNEFMRMLNRGSMNEVSSVLLRG